VAGLAAAAFRFAGLPLRSPIPLVDWSIFAAGVALAIGALSILALGYRRARERVSPPEIIHMQQIRDAQLQLRSALESTQAPRPYLEDDDVRVRHV
jgi:hypothetical protein